MAFINEKISKEDREKYNIDQINMRWNGAGSPQRDWAIDREREIWLREFNRIIDRDDNGAWDGRTVWDFYWKGILMSIKTQRSNFIHLNKERSEVAMTYQLLELYIPVENKNIDIETVLIDMAESFATYGSSGIYGQYINSSGEYHPYKKKDVTFDASNYELVDTNRFTC